LNSPKSKKDLKVKKKIKEVKVKRNITGERLKIAAEMGEHEG
jgi:hypothetical protein